MAVTPLRRSHDEPAAFDEFYCRQLPAISRFFARRVADAEAVLDLTAESFAQAYASRRRFRGSTDAEAQAWLFTIAHRQLAGYLRRGYADRSAMDRLGLERPAAGPDELQRVEELRDFHQVRGHLINRLDELPTGYREAVELRVIEELPFSEVAERLEITEPAARMRVSRALHQLRLSLSTSSSVEGTT